jgi:hypothetical protein
VHHCHAPLSRNTCCGDLRARRPLCTALITLHMQADQFDLLCGCPVLCTKLDGDVVLSADIQPGLRVHNSRGAYAAQADSSVACFQLILFEVASSLLGLHSLEGRHSSHYTSTLQIAHWLHVNRSAPCHRRQASFDPPLPE